MRRERLLTLEEAAAELIGVIDRDVVERAVAELRALQTGILEYTIPTGVVAPAVVERPWYDGPKPGDRCWPALAEYLKAEKGFDDDAIDSLDRASTKIVAHLPCPGSGRFAGRGLVVGYVQSGKTTNYTAVIAKAADEGYRLFIVLSGLHNNLRRQTQARLDDQLYELNHDLWIQLTSKLEDFGSPTAGADALLTGTHRVLCVVKKNAKRLRSLRRWLNGASRATLANCPVLVIDDEADQASVNTSAEDRSKINGLILQLLNDAPRSAYVGYTATPYANLFIDPSGEDLYPRDFIIDLERPRGYFGPEMIFGTGREQEGDDEHDDGYDFVRLVPPEELEALRPPPSPRRPGPVGP